MDRAAWRRKRIEQGLCGECGKPRSPESKWGCDACRKRARDSYRARHGSVGREPAASAKKSAEKKLYYWNRKALGLCVDCGIAREQVGRTMCDRCLTKHRDYVSRRARKAAKKPWMPHGNSLAYKKIMREKSNKDAAV